jgi:hypothetical protein
LLLAAVRLGAAAELVATDSFDAEPFENLDAVSAPTDVGETRGLMLRNALGVLINFEWVVATFSTGIKRSDEAIFFDALLDDVDFTLFPMAGLLVCTNSCIIDSYGDVDANEPLGESPSLALLATIPTAFAQETAEALDTVDAIEDRLDSGSEIEDTEDRGVVVLDMNFVNFRKEGSDCSLLEKFCRELLPLNGELLIDLIPKLGPENNKHCLNR